MIFAGNGNTNIGKLPFIFFAYLYKVTIKFVEFIM